MEVRKPDALRDAVAETTHTRHCPTVAGEPGSLITHVIAPSVCMKRQRDLYHKCHRCDYRGEAADFVSIAPQSKGRAKPDPAAQRNGSATSSSQPADTRRNDRPKG